MKMGKQPKCMSKGDKFLSPFDIDRSKWCVYARCRHQQVIPVADHTVLSLTLGRKSAAWSRAALTEAESESVASEVGAEGFGDGY